VGVLERAEPLPVATRVAEILGGPLLEIGSDAEGAARTGENDDADLVVPRCVLARPGELPEQAEVERVEPLGDAFS
jgi:hypothetical protein